MNKPALIQRDDVYTNHIHAEDLARISFISLFRGKPARTTNTVDDSRIKMADYFDEVAKAFNLPKAPRISKNEMKLFTTEKKISSMMASFFQESRLLKNERLKNELKIFLDFPNVVDYLRTLSKK
jgi:dTDP-4-dehydrorhamnose reductase